ncbi:hypothetical protein Athai_09500 [Actinocatenispora thailandica]|uniref:DUF2071 domain-containing protein n=1 Tax=Actinocatenispora thailandica TaxID=227318 RepID=A0A7R7DKU1_9ACTN|nr:DUF2071 domain-containing protein [Actinocatenispora thailandica]BCJ33447.1 hypothetical protein Athai_09500 [Actinocatenispora thailandica]
MDAPVGSDAEPVTATAPRPVPVAVLAQDWREVTFLHWAVSPAAVAPLLPAGLRPDLHEGRTYLGLVAFRMVRVGPPRLPVPYLGTFAETNVRVYSVDGRGRRGVVFLSLDAARLLPALVGRCAARLPYRWAAMRLRREPGGTVRYLSRTRWPGRGVRDLLAVRPGARIATPSATETFLTARWGLHTRLAGRTWYLPNIHQSWPLHRAELLDRDSGLVTASGLADAAADPVSVLWSPGVSVRFGPPKPA